MPGPAHPQIVDGIDAGHRRDGALSLLDQPGVDAVEEPAADVAAGADQQHHDRGTDQQPDDRIGKRESRARSRALRATTANEVNPSVRAWTPSATKAAEPIRRPTRIR